MSYTFLQEQGEESSADTFSDIPAYVLSRLNLIAEESCSNGNETESCQSSQYGMMSAHSTEHLGEEKLMLYAEDSLAKTSLQQEREKELQEREVVFGKKWQESLAKYDPSTHSWKTHQCLLLGDLEEFSETWPQWGIMQDGECWERIIAMLPTREKESGFWPTPRACSAMSANFTENTANAKFPNLETIVARKMMEIGRASCRERV